MSLTIRHLPDEVTEVVYNPNFVWPVLGVVGPCLWALILIVTHSDGSQWVIPSIILLISLFSLLVSRSYHAAFDAASKILTYTRGGLLNTQFSAEQVVCPFAEIEVVEIKRVTTRSADQYAIRLRRRNGYILDLSGPTLGFQESHEKAEAISQLLGLTVPPRAIDLGLTQRFEKGWVWV